MKNQIWSPMFQNLTPRLDFPMMKKVSNPAFQVMNWSTKMTIDFL